MTVIPDNAAICDCWSKASTEERATAYVGRNRPSFGPKGMRDCPKCRGAGFWLPEDSIEAVVGRLRAVEAAAREVVRFADDARRVFAEDLIEGAIILRPETFYALRDLLSPEPCP